MKRKFFRILLLSFTLALLLACPAYADDYGSDSIRVDEALALQMGDRFFSAVMSDIDVTADNAVKMYNSNSHAIGYVVHAYYEGCPWLRGV